jgi:predicted HicB family RNase H-like nuclease
VRIWERKQGIIGISNTTDTGCFGKGEYDMNNALEYKGFLGTVEYSAADDLLYGKVVGVKSLISYEGESIHALKKDFEGAVEDYLEMCAERGIEPEKTYKGSFNVRIPPELHQTLALYSVAHRQSMNAVVEEAIKRYVSG